MNSFLNYLKTEIPASFWYALYTRPHFEKIINEELHRTGIESFLPLRTVIHIWSDRKKKTEEPLFPSYVFVQVTPKERLNALQVRGVVRMVSFNGRPARIPDCQIEAIKRVTSNNLDAEPYPYFSKGDRVEVKEGVLAGLQGFVLNGQQKKYFVISVEALNKSLAIKIDGRLLKRLPPLLSKRPLNIY